MAQLKLCPFKTAPGRVFQQPVKPCPDAKQKRGAPGIVRKRASARLLKKLLAVEETADPSPLKRFGMTKTQDFYGAAKAVPLQNGAPADFFSSL